MMREINLCRWFCTMFIISFLFSSVIDGKGFGGGRGGGFGGGRGAGFGGGRGGGFKFSGPKGAGSFRKSPGIANAPSKSRSGSSLNKNAMSFGAGALTGVAAYSLMHSMSSSYHRGVGYYNPGYGYGETCVNNDEMNGTQFGSFRCPLNNFPINARYCCGEYGHQYCCIDGGTYRPRNSSNLGWLFLILIICFIMIFLFAKHRRQQQQRNIIMIPVNPTLDEQTQRFYQPPAPSMGYPAPPATAYPYEMPPGSFAPNQPPYQVQTQTMNPYLVKEAGPPTYEEVVRNNQNMPPNKPN